MENGKQNLADSKETTNDKLLLALEKIVEKLDNLEKVTKDLPQKILNARVPILDMDKTLKVGKATYKSPSEEVKNEETGEMELHPPSMGDITGILSLLINRVGELESRSADLAVDAKGLEELGDRILVKLDAHTLVTDKYILGEIGEIREFSRMAYEALKHFAERDIEGYDRYQNTEHTFMQRALPSGKKWDRYLPLLSSMVKVAAEEGNDLVKMAVAEERKWEKEQLGRKYGKTKKKKV